MFIWPVPFLFPDRHGGKCCHGCCIEWRECSAAGIGWSGFQDCQGQTWNRWWRWLRSEKCLRSASGVSADIRRQVVVWCCRSPLWNRKVHDFKGYSFTDEDLGEREDVSDPQRWHRMGERPKCLPCVWACTPTDWREIVWRGCVDEKHAGNRGWRPLYGWLWRKHPEEYLSQERTEW